MDLDLEDLQLAMTNTTTMTGTTTMTTTMTAAARTSAAALLPLPPELPHVLPHPTSAPARCLHSGPGTSGNASFLASFVQNSDA